MWLYRLFGFLIVVMFIVNGYMTGLFSNTGVSKSPGGLPFIPDIPVRHNASVPSVRFCISRKTGRLDFVAAGDNTPNWIVAVSQRIAQQWQNRNWRSAHENKHIQLPAALSTLLKSIKRRSLGDFETLWKSLQQWPFSDPLRLMKLGDALEGAKTARILKAKAGDKGTQLKVDVMLEGNQRAFFKPKWYDRGIEIFGPPYAGKDRHWGEIAAFYVNLVLGYFAAPIVTGRKVKLGEELLPVTTPPLNHTFYLKDEHWCFWGVCRYCSRSEPRCETSDGTVEGALVLFISQKFRTVVSPWRRIYRSSDNAPWQLDEFYCSKNLLNNANNLRMQTILDMIGVAVFDFLIGNGDRHHFERVKTLGNSHSGRFLLMDNGKSFGNPYEDYIDLLAPLFQCCKIRDSLVKTLKSIEGNLGSFVDLMSQEDPLYPVLDPPNLRALDRRVQIVISTVHHCISTKGWRNVVY